MQGTLTEVKRDPDRVVVQLGQDDGNRTVVLPKVAFTTENATGFIVATRNQIPIILAYAVTGQLTLYTSVYNVIADNYCCIPQVSRKLIKSKPLS